MLFWRAFFLLARCFLVYGVLKAFAYCHGCVHARALDFPCESFWEGEVFWAALHRARGLSLFSLFSSSFSSYFFRIPILSEVHGGDERGG